MRGKAVIRRLPGLSPSRHTILLQKGNDREHWSNLVTYVHHVPGRLRLRLGRLKANEPAAQAACEALRPLPGVTHVESNPATGSVTIRYDSRESALDAVWKVLHREGLVASPVPDLGVPVETGPARGVTTGSRIVGGAAEAVIGFLVEKLLERSAIALIGALI